MTQTTFYQFFNSVVLSVSLTIHESTVFFNDTATTEIYTYRHPLYLHDDLPISRARAPSDRVDRQREHRREGGARGAALGLHQQICRGLSGQALLSGLRTVGRGRAARDRPRQGRSEERRVGKECVST